MPHRNYAYIGPQQIADRVKTISKGTLITSPDDVISWIEESQQAYDQSGNVIVTFVIDQSGALRIADRRSEHIACAGGEPVLSAGEMTFHVADQSVRIAWVTNQSTGYCPEPESWSAVETALNKAGFDAPPRFDQQFTFRQCLDCRMINIVKDKLFKCGVCAAPLPK